VTSTERTQPSFRHRRARSDLSVKTPERVFDLPAGSLRIVRSDGRKMRSDAFVDRLRKLWKR
jgi:hypothetical protein